MTLKKKIIQGVSWNSITAIITQVLNYTFFIVLAKKLSPNDFGIVAMILAITGLAEIIKDAGFGVALVQKENLEDAQISTVFWCNLFFGVLLSSTFFILAPYISYFYNNLIDIKLIQTSGLSFFLSALTMVQSALMRKRLEFKKIAIFLFFSTLLSGTLSISLAYKNAGVWALVWKDLSRLGILVILYWYYIKWKPKFIFKLDRIRSLWSFGLNYTGAKLIMGISQKLDDVLIGKFIGASSLGVYKTAYNFLFLPIRVIKGQFYTVFFSAFVKIQDDKCRQKKMYLKLSAITAMIIYPLMMGFYSIAEEFVAIFLNDEWLNIIPILKVFCIASLFISLGYPGILFLANNKSKELLELTLFTRTLFIFLLLLGLYFDSIIGVSYGVAFGFILDSIILNVYACRIIDIKLNELFVVIQPFLFISIFMAVLLKFYTILFDLQLVLLLCSKILIGVVIVLSFIILFTPKPINGILSSLKEFNNKY